MKWYALHVMTGAELEAQRQLKEAGIDAIVMQEVACIRRGGQWKEEVRIWMPGYVFLLMNYSPAKYYTIKAVSGYIGLLPKHGNPMPLPPKDVLWLLSLCSEVLVPSVVDFSGMLPVVLSGPLKDLEQYIVKYDRHRRRVLLDMSVLGTPKKIALSIIPADADLKTESKRGLIRPHASRR